MTLSIFFEYPFQGIYIGFFGYTFYVPRDQNIIDPLKVFSEIVDALAENKIKIVQKFFFLSLITPYSICCF
jgi:hypothetical protein